MTKNGGLLLIGMLLGAIATYHGIWSHSTCVGRACTFWYAVPKWIYQIF